MQLGSFELHALETSRFQLDGGAMFGTVPKPLWSKKIPADEQNRIPMAARVLLVRDLKSKRNLLIDTGMGEKWDEKKVQIYGIDYSITLQKNLQSLGLSEKDITDVLITHLHFDHTGGSTERNQKGELQPTFPNANYYVQQKNYAWAIEPNPREAASYLAENFVPLYETGQLVLCDGAEDAQHKIAWPGLRIWLSNGHTKAMQCPLIQLEGQSFFFPADLIPTTAHLPVPWVMGFDIDVVQTIQEREEVLQQASKNSWILIYEHDPFCPASTVQKGKKHYEVKKESAL